MSHGTLTEFVRYFVQNARESNNVLALVDSCDMFSVYHIVPPPAP
jgi:hypothetical protein